ncbi:MAG: SBBP repeat-containing protein, partial [Acidobacteriota bacterium]|nr:SBBP repeat-containing protein [Acidobacteriota bacterium]
ALQTAFGGSGGSGKYLTGLGGPFGDAFVAKLNPAGNALVYATYLGGSADEKGAAIAVDSAGNAYVGGTTLSTNFPAVNAYQSAYKGSGGSPAFVGGDPSPFLLNGDGFLAAVNPAGSALLFSTYLGGSLDDGVTALALDASNNVYAGGFTLSSNFPVQSAYQTTYGGSDPAAAQPVISTGDGFVAKFTSAGKLVYSTYLGGSGDDAVMGIAVDAQGAVYATGFTSSANFPGVGAKSAQSVFAGPAHVHDQTGFVWGDAFVAKLAPTGASLVYSTYLGGSGEDAGMSIAVDQAGEAIVGGFAMSSNLKVTSDAVQKTWAGSGSSNFTDPTGDGFLARLSPDGSSFLYLSYYGGEASEAITSLAIDGQGRVVASGNTTSSQLPVTANAAQRTFGGQSSMTPTETTGDAFVAIFTGVASVAAPAPVITSVVNGASFQPGVTANAWVTITGSLLASGIDNWNNSVVNGVLPSKLDGVSVMVGGKPAFINYISGGQINAVAPDIPAGPTTVTVTNSSGTSAPFTVAANVLAPAFFPWYAPSGTVYAVATRTDYSYAVKNGTFSVPTVAAKPGEVIILWGTAFGPTNPPTPSGVAAPASAPTADPVTVTIGTTPAPVYSSYGYLAQGYASVYQIAITVPATLPDGDYPVVATIKGVSSPSTTMLTVAH